MSKQHRPTCPRAQRERNRQTKCRVGPCMETCARTRNRRAPTAGLRGRASTKIYNRSGVLNERYGIKTLDC